jgi:hypothetical protein
MMKRYHFRRTVVQGAFVTAETEQDARRDTGRWRSVS